MAHQEEMTENFFMRMGQVGMVEVVQNQNQRLETGAQKDGVGVGRPDANLGPNVWFNTDPSLGVGTNPQGAKGRVCPGVGMNDVNPRAELERLNENQNAGAQSEEYAPEFPHGVEGQAKNANSRLPLDDDGKFTKMITQAMRGGLSNRSLGDMNRSPFTPNIWYCRNPLEFKLSSLETYDEKSNPTIHLMRHIWQIECWGHLTKLWDGVFLCIWQIWLCYGSSSGSKVP